MKGIAVWVWVIGGIIIGMVIFTSFFQIMTMLVANKESEAAKQNIDDITSIASSFCEMGPGRSTEKRFILPNAVNSVFASNDQLSASFKGGRNYGEYLCIKVSELRDAYCVKANCELELAFAVKEKTVGSILNRLLGRYEYSEYTIKISRTECGVALLGENETSKASCAKCDHLPLMQCKGHTIAAYLEPNVVVLTDFTQIYNCCDEATFTLLKNTANFFGGSKILLIFEHVSLSDKLPQSIGAFDIDFFRHTANVEQDALKNYDQVWIFLPGFCNLFDPQGKTRECGGIVGWNDDEVNKIKNFVDGGGKLFLVSDYTPYTTQSVVNAILNKLGYSAKFSEGCDCGCGIDGESSIEISKHPLTENINSWVVKSGAGFTC